MKGLILKHEQFLLSFGFIASMFLLFGFIDYLNAENVHELVGSFIAIPLCIPALMVFKRLHDLDRRKENRSF